MVTNPSHNIPLLIVPMRFIYEDLFIGANFFIICAKEIKEAKTQNKEEHNLNPETERNTKRENKENRQDDTISPCLRV